MISFKLLLSAFVATTVSLCAAQYQPIQLVSFKQNAAVRARLAARWIDYYGNLMQVTFPGGYHNKDPNIWYRYNFTEDSISLPSAGTPFEIFLDVSGAKDIHGGWMWTLDEHWKVPGLNLEASGNLLSGIHFDYQVVPTASDDSEIQSKNKILVQQQTVSFSVSPPSSFGDDV